MGTRLGKRSRRFLRRPQGFTLVELMIAMALMGVLTAMIYGLFARTSDSLAEAEALSTTLDRARFAISEIRSDLQMAGSHGSSNSLGADPWVQPPRPEIVVQPIRVHDEWTDQSVYTGAIAGLAAANPESKFNSFIVIGAIDYPMSFMANGLTFAGENVSMTITPTERGLGRLQRMDPFFVTTQSDLNPAGEFATNFGAAGNRMNGRLVRIMDQNGFMQFGGVGAYNGNTAELRVDSVAIRENDGGPGLERYVEPDVEHDIAFLDAYYYHVRPSAVEPTNLQLLRSRIDLLQLARVEGALGQTVLEGLIIDGETVVVADYVVDFRVWFECVNAAGQMEDFWPQTWDFDPSAQTCISANAQNSEIERARVAHVRLSLRTDTENPNRPHFTLEGQSPGLDEDGQLATYDVVPEARGAAAVMTVQTSIDLVNLAIRGVL